MDPGGVSTGARQTGCSRPHNARVRSTDALVLASAHRSWIVLVSSASNGRLALFLHDLWLDGSSIQRLAPNLSNTVRARTRAMQLVCETLHGERWIRDIEGVLDMAALEQYVNLWVRLQEL
jgi:hypothetical protein